MKISIKKPNRQLQIVILLSVLLGGPAFSEVLNTADPALQNASHKLEASGAPQVKNSVVVLGKTIEVAAPCPECQWARTPPVDLLGKTNPSDADSAHSDPAKGTD